MLKLYPNWVMRIYTNIPEIYWQHVFCPLICAFPKQFTVCDVNKLPAFGNLSDLFELSWRYFVLADPDVDVFLIRSLDYLLTEREQSVVTKFELDNTFWFHNIRDHPMQKWPISSGFWGGKNRLIGGNVGMELLRGFIKKVRIFLHLEFELSLGYRSICLQIQRI